MAKALKKVASVALPIIGTMIGGPVGGALGGAAGGAIGGGGLKGALIGGALGGLGGGFSGMGPASTGIGFLDSLNSGITGALSPIKSAFSSLGNSVTGALGMGDVFGGASAAAPTGEALYQGFGANATPLYSGFGQAGANIPGALEQSFNPASAVPSSGSAAWQNSSAFTPAATSAGSNSGSLLSNMISKIKSNPLDALAAGTTIAQALGNNGIEGEQTQQDILNRMQQQQQQQQQFSQQTTDMLNNAALGRAPAVSPVSDYYTYGERPEASFFTPANKIKYARGGSVNAYKNDWGSAYKDDPQPRLIKIFGNDLNTLSEEERGNALSYMRSNKNWSDEDIRHMSTNPSGRIKKYASGGYVKGGALSGGQDDDIDAKLSHGEYVIPADVVSALGDGANDNGAAKLDKMLKKVRQHKTGRTKFPPKAKPIGKYVGALSHG